MRPRLGRRPLLRGQRSRLRRPRCSSARCRRRRPRRRLAQHAILEPHRPTKRPAMLGSGGTLDRGSTASTRPGGPCRPRPLPSSAPSRPAPQPRPAERRQLFIGTLVASAEGEPARPGTWALGRPIPGAMRSTAQSTLRSAPAAIPLVQGAGPSKSGTHPAAAAAPPRHGLARRLQGGGSLPIFLPSAGHRPGRSAPGLAAPRRPLRLAALPRGLLREVATATGAPAPTGGKATAAITEHRAGRGLAARLRRRA